MNTLTDLWIPWLLENSLKGSILFLVFLPLRSLLKRTALPASLWFVLWLIIGLRFILPAGIPSEWSLYGGVEATIKRSGQMAAALTTPSASLTPTDTGSMPNPLAWLPLIWALGAFGFAGWSLLHMRRKGVLLVRQRPCTREPVLELLEDCKQALSIHIPISVTFTDQLQVPALAGWMRPRIFIPVHMGEAGNSSILRHALLHELQHVRRHDIPLQWVAWLIWILNWFNPLVWLAWRYFQSDLEMACDASVTRRGDRNAQIAYARDLLSVASLSPRQKLQPGTLALMENTQHIQSRIQRLSRPMRLSFSGLTLILAAALGLAAAATADPMTETLAPATAQTPEAAARKAGELWLKHYDKGQYTLCYTTASPILKEALTEAQWVAALEALKPQLGELTKRQFVGAIERANLPGVEGGPHIIMTLTGEYTRLPKTVETLTCSRNDNGQWLVSGYYVRPGASE